ncbi:hypothetical protein MmiHf6_14390 [Methanimicrococcus hongohii]|uniref:Uncharacterized protein n=2 Tax=Methanimicrococcus hongohii TaxID=3028295 RepID=A0AA96ZT39_9EURY|nr:hypothetical protein MmiHf6_14390 [Methanimicrococcus sp. Hf6]
MTQEGSVLRATVIISWSWSQRPLLSWNDSIGISYYGHPNTVHINSNSSALVQYDTGFGVFYSSYPISVSKNGTGASATFPMSRVYSAVNGWARCGTATINMQTLYQGNYSPQYINMTAGYVHQAFTITPTIEFGTSGLGLSVTPKGSADVTNSKSYTINRP